MSNSKPLNSFFLSFTVLLLVCIYIWLIVSFVIFKIWIVPGIILRIMFIVIFLISIIYSLKDI